MENRRVTGLTLFLGSIVFMVGNYLIMDPMIGEANWNGASWLIPLHCLNFIVVATGIVILLHSLQAPTPGEDDNKPAPVLSIAWLLCMINTWIYLDLTFVKTGMRDTPYIWNQFNLWQVWIFLNIVFVLGPIEQIVVILWKLLKPKPQTHPHIKMARR